MTQEAYGIENLKKVFLLVIDAGNEAGILAENNQLKWYEKLLKSPIIKISQDVITVIGVDWKLFPKEIKDVSSAEMEELKAFFIQNFDIPEDNIEAIIKQVFTVVTSLIDNVVSIVELSKQLKKK
jgi:hypothetical protein